MMDQLGFKNGAQKAARNIVALGAASNIGRRCFYTQI
jgi:hypothetical protein